MDKLFEQFTVNVPYGVLITVSVFVLFLIIKSVQHLGLEHTREVVYKGFVLAEHNFQTNEEKFDFVVKIAKDNIPTFIRPFVTESRIRKTIQLWFDICKDLLDDGKLNDVKNYTSLN